MQVLKIVGLIALAALLGVVALIVFRISPKMHASLPQPIIATFEDCVAAGNPIMESYPPQCRSADGRLFVQDVQPPQQQGEGMTFNGCAVAGCSQQLCVSAGEAANTVSTCEYRASYACYREASCEPQADGKCGWTQTPQLTRCLANPPAFEEPQVQ
jgi:hypothetical protein